MRKLARTVLGKENPALGNAENKAEPECLALIAARKHAQCILANLGGKRRSNLGISLWVSRYQKTLGLDPKVSRISQSSVRNLSLLVVFR